MKSALFSLFRLQTEGGCFSLFQRCQRDFLSDIHCQDTHVRRRIKLNLYSAIFKDGCQKPVSCVSDTTSKCILSATIPLKSNQVKYVVLKRAIYCSIMFYSFVLLTLTILTCFKPGRTGRSLAR